jgi:ZIP family zinc transporter
MALGTGVLIGSVSFELVDEALKTQTVAWVALLVLVGAAVFTVGDWLLTRRGGGERKDPEGAQADGSPLAIVLGLGPGRDPGVVRARPHGPPRRGERVAAGRGGPVQPARGHGVVQGLRRQDGPNVGSWGCGWRWWSSRPWPRPPATFCSTRPAAVPGAGPGVRRWGAAGDAGRDTLLPEAYKVVGVVIGPLVVARFALSLALSAI